MIEIARVDIYHFSAPIKEPILTSFGAIVARNNVLLRVEDQDGAHGWGEIWASFPPRGAENKVRLLESIVLPTALGRRYQNPAEAWNDLTRRMRRHTLQSAEPGPFAACLAGIDVALWDRRRARPACHFGGHWGARTCPSRYRLMPPTSTQAARRRWSPAAARAATVPSRSR